MTVIQLLLLSTTLTTRIIVILRSNKQLVVATVIALIAVGIPIYFWISKSPGFVNLEALPNGGLNKVQEQTLNMVTEINKFLISLVTLMYGAIGFLLMYYRKDIALIPVSVPFLTALVLLGATYFFSFLTYSQVTAELAQNALGLTPSKSRILYYLELEFVTFFGASLLMLLIFIFVLFANTAENASAERQKNENKL